MQTAISKQRLWDMEVSEAKRCLRVMHAYRMQVADHALRACEIIHGGRNNIDNIQVETLKKFAEDIGIAYKTLHTWVKIKERVVDQLPIEFVDELKYSDLRGIHNELMGGRAYNKKQTVKEIALKVINKTDTAKILERALIASINLNNNLKKVSYTDIDKDLVERINENVTETYERVKGMMVEP